MQMFFIRRLFERSLAGKIDAELATTRESACELSPVCFRKKGHELLQLQAIIVRLISQLDSAAELIF